MVAKMMKWDNEGDKSLWLFTAEEYAKLPNGIELESISGNKCVKGRDHIDMDVRFNHIAYGVRDPYNHPNKDVLLIIALTQNYVS